MSGLSNILSRLRFFLFLWCTRQESAVLHLISCYNAAFIIRCPRFSTLLNIARLQEGALHTRHIHYVGTNIIYRI